MTASGETASGDAALGSTDMPHAEKVRCREAALRARRLYPGPLGDLAHRELSAYADFGHRFSTDALVPDLATAILAAR